MWPLVRLLRRDSYRRGVRVLRDWPLLRPRRRLLQQHVLLCRLRPNGAQLLLLRPSEAPFLAVRLRRPRLRRLH